MTDTIETRPLSPLDSVSAPLDRNTGQSIGFQDQIGNRGLSAPHGLAPLGPLQIEFS